jgi:hypothetical protein
MHEVVGILLDDDGMRMDVRGLMQKLDSNEEPMPGVMMQVSVPEYLHAGGTLAELMDFLAYLTKHAPDVAAAAARDADAAGATEVAAPAAAQASAAAVAVGSPASRKRPAESPGGAACRSSPRVRSGTGV